MKLKRTNIHIFEDHREAMKQIAKAHRTTAAHEYRQAVIIHVEKFKPKKP